MRNLSEIFNRSGFSRMINSPGGRVFRVVAGIAFLTAGFLSRSSAIGVLSMIWGILPLSAGSLDVCYISAVLGGPLSGRTIRVKYHGSEHGDVAR